MSGSVKTHFKGVDQEAFSCLWLWPKELKQVACCFSQEWPLYAMLPMLGLVCLHSTLDCMYSAMCRVITHGKEELRSNGGNICISVKFTALWEDPQSLWPGFSHLQQNRGKTDPGPALREVITFVYEKSGRIYFKLFLQHWNKNKNSCRT